MYDFASQISSSHFACNSVCFRFQLGILETKRISKLLISFPNAVIFSFGFEQKLTQVFMYVRGFVKGYF